MTAWGHPGPRSLDDPDCFVRRDVPRPVPGPTDLLLRVRAVGMNPLDAKLRAKAKVRPGDLGILGYEGAGIVEAAGREVRGLSVGDRVAWLGQITRPGAMAEYCCVDARLAARVPGAMSFEHAAAAPMAFLTAEGLLFERLGLRGAAGVLAIVNGAGGVGSAAIQLARRETRMTIVATAGRPDTERWCRELGAHHVVSHRSPVSGGLASLGIDRADAIASLTNTTGNFPDLVTCLAPFGTIGIIDEPKGIDVSLLRPMGQGICYFGAFVPALSDRWHQGACLGEALEALSRGEMRPILHDAADEISVDALRGIHGDLEAGRAIGKRVVLVPGA